MEPSIENLCIISGNANRPLAQKIADHIGVRIYDAIVSKFNNGETQVMITESIRGKDIFIIQPTSQPVNDNLMELSRQSCLIMRMHGRTEKLEDVNQFQQNSLQI